MLESVQAVAPADASQDRPREIRAADVRIRQVGPGEVGPREQHLPRFAPVRSASVKSADVASVRNTPIDCVPGSTPRLAWTSLARMSLACAMGETILARDRSASDRLASGMMT